jgi:hypothetical protein
MLINKGFSNGDVLSIKLISGEEIIARFDSEATDSMTISRPLAITMAGQGLGMIPWMFLGGKDEVTLQKSHIIATMTAKKDAADQYVQGTTGIALR